MRNGSRPNYANGFTLIELLLGAVISAILLSALYGIFHGTLQSQARAYSDLEDMAPRNQVMAILKKDLENMVVPNGIFSGSVLGLVASQGSGRADTLQFNTSSGKISATMPWGDIQQIAYSLDSGDGTTNDSGARFIRAVTRNLLPANSEDQSESTVLLQGVQSLEFEYYDGDAWTEEGWDSTTTENTPPQAVRVRITFIEQNKKRVATEPLEIVCEIAAQSPTATAADEAAASASKG